MPVVPNPRATRCFACHINAPQQLEAPETVKDKQCESMSPITAKETCDTTNIGNNFCLSVCLSVCLPACLPGWLALSLSLYLSRSLSLSLSRSLFLSPGLWCRGFTPLSLALSLSPSLSLSLSLSLKHDLSFHPYARLHHFLIEAGCSLPASSCFPCICNGKLAGIAQLWRKCNSGPPANCWARTSFLGGSSEFSSEPIISALTST